MNYDLIIIGNTNVGRYAALTAILWEARVALVTHNITDYSEADGVYNFTLTQLTQVSAQWNKINPSISPSSEIYQKWTQEVIEVVTEETALDKLAAKGVDVIDGKGEFCRLPKQALIVNREKLKARAYLIATETFPLPIQVPNLPEVGYLSLSDLKNYKSLDSLPENLTIVGDCPTAITLAQVLARLKKKVTLSLAKSRLFPTEDHEITNLLKIKLEADGIDVLTDSPLLQVKNIGSEKWLQLGKKSQSTEELIFLPEYGPNLEGLNLEGVGVHYTRQGLSLNAKLQTSNPKIYGCGAVAGGYSCSNLGQYEAIIALKNGLFFPINRVKYQTIPYSFATDPPLGRVGMTEAQAKRRYGDQVVVIRESFKTDLMSIVFGETTGLLKIVLCHNGEILGGQVLGRNAEALVSAIAAAIAKKMKIKQLASLSFPQESVTRLLVKVGQQWEELYYYHHPLLREVRKRYFLIRRSYSNSK